MATPCMNLAISIAEHEIEMAHRWFDWVCELGGTDGHSLYLIPATGVNITDILPKAQKAFNGRVSIIKDEEGETSNWQITDPIRSASGPNSAFRQVAWHFYHNKLGPYFWCELDCIPTKREWLDRFESEYKVAVANGKVFLAAHVLIENVPEHGSGNAVYPTNVPEEAPTLIMRTEWTPRDQERSFELAFDIAGAAEVIPKAQWTNLIQHKFRYEGFKSRAEFDAVIDPNAVVFHSDKKGTIFPYLRQNLSGVPAQADSQATPTPSGEGVRIKQGEARELRDGVGRSLDGSNPVTSRDAAQTTLEKKRAALVKAREARASKRKEGDVPCATIKRQSTPQSHSFQDLGSESLRANEKPKNVASNVAPTVQPSGATTVASHTFNPELESVIAQNQVIRNGLPAMSPPWENREDTEKDVKMLCEALALFTKAPIYKARVRQALREAKIIK